MVVAALARQPKNAPYTVPSAWIAGRMEGPSWPLDAPVVARTSTRTGPKPAGGGAAAAFCDSSMVAVLPVVENTLKSLLPMKTRSTLEPGPVGTVLASTQGWSSPARSTSTVIRPGRLKLALRRMFRWLLSVRRIPAYSTPDVPPKRRVVSPVLLPPGSTTFRFQVWPPSTEMKIGALPELIGSRVKAEAAMCCGSAGSTATLHSLSRPVSPLSEFGIMLTSSMDILVAPPSADLPEQPLNPGSRLHGMDIQRVKCGQADHPVSGKALLVLVALEDEGGVHSRRELRGVDPELIGAVREEHSKPLACGLALVGGADLHGGLPPVGAVLAGGARLFALQRMGLQDPAGDDEVGPAQPLRHPVIICLPVRLPDQAAHVGRCGIPLVTGLGARQLEPADFDHGQAVAVDPGAGEEHELLSRRDGVTLGRDQRDLLAGQAAEGGRGLQDAVHPDHRAAGVGRHGRHRRGVLTLDGPVEYQARLRGPLLNRRPVNA